MNAAMSSMLAKRWPVLIRREFWEHRALWIMPLVIAALYLLSCIFVGSADLVRAPRSPMYVNGSPILFAQLIFTTVLFALTSLVIFFYLVDCLYTERKDRSILFWKSLPVSDTVTVLTKLAVALLIVPLGLFALALVTNLIAYVILYVGLHSRPVLGQFLNWDTAGWLHLNLTVLVYVFILALWYAPVAAYQLLVSAWAKSNVLLWTVLPPLILAIAEWRLLGTGYVWGTLRDRFGINLVGIATSGRTAHSGFGARPGVFDGVDVLGLLADPATWIGVVVAAVLVFAAIRIRRYRDDT
jgi:ABC-2 type transport system permease protein